MEEERANRFQGFLDMTSEMNRMRQLGMYGYEPGWEDRERTHANAWVPAADVYAEGEDLFIRLALAGVKREDVELTLQENVLTVSGERNRDLDEEEVSFYVHELYYGVFRRTMTLPSGVDQSKINAEFYNGLMEITIRGAAAAEPRRIEIRERSDSEQGRFANRPYSIKPFSLSQRSATASGVSPSTSTA